LIGVISNPMGPKRSYLICTTPRSGSTVLSEVLESTGVAGRPEEYFQQLAATGLMRGPLDYLGDDLLAELLPGAPPRLDAIANYAPRRFAGFPASLDWVRGEAPPRNGVLGIRVMAAAGGGLEANRRGMPGAAPPAATADLLAAVLPNLSYVFLVRRDKVRQ